MISSSCKKLSRLEIIYSCVERIIKEAYKKASDNLPDKFKVYLEEGHRNDTLYRSKSADLDSKLKTITAEGIELYYIFKGTNVEETEKSKLLARMPGEQTQYAFESISVLKSMVRVKNSSNKLQKVDKRADKKDEKPIFLL